MDNAQAAVSAVIGAAVATATVLIVDNVRKAKDAKKAAAAEQLAEWKGWCAGRESIFQSFQAQVTPQDFTTQR